MMSLEEAIKKYKRDEKVYRIMAHHNNSSYVPKKIADEYKQLAEWLCILKKAKFEYDEAWRILTHPTPDVRYPDINRAKMILDVFRNSVGLLDAERRTDADD